MLDLTNFSAEYVKSGDNFDVRTSIGFPSLLKLIFPRLIYMTSLTISLKIVVCCHLLAEVVPKRGGFLLSLLDVADTSQRCDKQLANHQIDNNKGCLHPQFLDCFARHLALRFVEPSASKSDLRYHAQISTAGLTHSKCLHALKQDLSRFRRLRNTHEKL
jgi:hypothetical protein